MVDKWPLLLFVCSKIRHLFVLVINTVLNNIQSILHCHSKKRSPGVDGTRILMAFYTTRKNPSFFFLFFLFRGAGWGGWRSYSKDTGDRSPGLRHHPDKQTDCHALNPHSQNRQIFLQTIKHQTELAHIKKSATGIKRSLSGLINV